MEEAYRDSFREFRLTFVRQKYYESVQRHFSILGVEIFKPKQIMLFLNLVLKAGVHSEQYNTPSLFSSNNGVCIHGDTCLDNKGIKNSYQMYLWDNKYKELIVKIEGNWRSKPNKVYAKQMHATSQYTEIVDLNHFKFDKMFLKEENLPRYINNPILGVYAKEKLAGLI